MTQKPGVDGSILLDLVGSSATDGVCSNGWVCLWADANLSGARVSYTLCDINGDGKCDWNNLTVASFNDVMSSWWNNKNVDAKWAYDVDGGGATRCMQPNTQLSYVGATDNDQASSLKIFKNATAC